MIGYGVVSNIQKAFKRQINLPGTPLAPLAPWGHFAFGFAPPADGFPPAPAGFPPVCAFSPSKRLYYIFLIEIFLH